VNDDDLRWPALQQHADGALVTPGWARVDNVKGHWLRGYGTLAQDFFHDPVKGTSLAASFPDTGQTLALTTTSTWPEHGIVRFVYIRSGGDVGTTWAAFTEGAGGVPKLDWSAPLPHAATRPLFTDIATIEALLTSLSINGVVADADVDGDGANEWMWCDPAVNIMMMTGSGWLTGSTVQLLDQDNGRCEWVGITGALDRGLGKRYLINEQGWDMTGYLVTPDPRFQPRGAMRTPWRDDLVGADKKWPMVGNRVLVLPVQRQLSRSVHLESGDVVTVVPDAVTVNGKRREPVQILVRHAPRDGYSSNILPAGGPNDVDEYCFALTHRVPDALSDPIADAQTMLIGRGWSGDDLSPYNNMPGRRGALPRHDHLALTAGGPIHVFIGSGDTRTGRTGDVIIDDLCAGNLVGVAGANEHGSIGCGIIQIGSSSTGVIGSAATDLPVAVKASMEIFKSQNNNDAYGLVLINGEVFAWRKGSTPADAVLIARALLGTQAMTHRLGIAGGQLTTVGQLPNQRQVQTSLPAMTLPMGPVAELCSPLAAGAHNIGVDVIEVRYANFFKDPILFDTPNQDHYADDPRLIMRLPFVLVHEPACAPTVEAKVEVLRLFNRPASTQRITASWLRGLYSTTDQDWTAPYQPGTHWPSWSPTDPGQQPVTAQSAGSLNPIIIGWWPRFAPGLTGAPTAESLRSRSFAWAGFALRLSGSRFDGHEPSGSSDPGGPQVLRAGVGGIADVGVADDAGCALTASALAAEENTGNVFDWDKAWAHRASLIMPTNTALVDPFNWNRFWLKEVDGAELRVHWSATGNGTTDLLRAADAAGRAPRLEKIKLRCVAPNRVLAVEEVR